MIEYRDATTRDAATLAVLARDTFVEKFGHLYRPADLAAFLSRHTDENWAAELGDPRFAVRLAETAGTAIGYLKLGPASLPVQPRGAAIELRQFYVRAGYQGAGIGGTMARWALDEARARGAAEMHLSVFTENPDARRFYERMGFERIGRYSFMVGDQEDEDDLMRLTL